MSLWRTILQQSLRSISRIYGFPQKSLRRKFSRRMQALNLWENSSKKSRMRNSEGLNFTRWLYREKRKKDFLNSSREFYRFLSKEPAESRHTLIGSTFCSTRDSLNTKFSLWASRLFSRPTTQLISTGLKFLRFSSFLPFNAKVSDTCFIRKSTSTIWATKNVSSL